VTTPIVLPWPLQNSLEDATRVLFEPVGSFLPSISRNQRARPRSYHQLSIVARVQEPAFAFHRRRHCRHHGTRRAARAHWCVGAHDKAGLRSLARSALVEVAEQLARALAQISTLPGTPALRREEIKLQIALINSLMHVKGYAAPETKEAGRFTDRAGGGVGRGLEDLLLLFSVCVIQDTGDGKPRPS
jgi:hypothetical protein